MTAPAREQRPMLAVVATPGTTDGLRPLLRQLALSVDVRPLDRLGGGRRPDAVLVTSAAALAAAPPGVASAVWVDHGEEVPTGCAVVLCDRPDLLDVRSSEAGRSATVVFTPRHGLDDVTALPVLPPLLRTRWCERYELPTDHVAEVGDTGVDAGTGPAHDDRLAELAIAAAAVVTGPLLATALALGTPVITSAPEAARLGAVAGEHLEVAQPGSADADALAAQIVADDEHAARLSAAARTFAEQRLDVGLAARNVLMALGLAAPPAPFLPTRLEERMAELRVLPGSRVHRRAEAAVAGLLTRGS